MTLTPAQIEELERLRREQEQPRRIPLRIPVQPPPQEPPPDEEEEPTRGPIIIPI